MLVLSPFISVHSYVISIHFPLKKQQIKQNDVEFDSDFAVYIINSRINPLRKYLRQMLDANNVTSRLCIEDRKMVQFDFSICSIAPWNWHEILERIKKKRNHIHTEQANEKSIIEENRRLIIRVSCHDSQTWFIEAIRPNKWVGGWLYSRFGGWLFCGEIRWMGFIFFFIGAIVPVGE